MLETTFGERVRAMRVERRLSQDGLAALMAPVTRGGLSVERTNSWVSYIESGKQEPSLDDLLRLAEVLQTDVRWLLTGDAPGMSEFVARMSQMESMLDGRGRREVIATAERRVEEYREQRLELREQIRLALVASGVHEDQVAVAVEQSLRTILGPDYIAPEDSEPAQG